MCFPSTAGFLNFDPFVFKFLLQLSYNILNWRSRDFFDKLKFAEKSFQVDSISSFNKPVMFTRFWDKNVSSYCTQCKIVNCSGILRQAVQTVTKGFARTPSRHNVVFKKFQKCFKTCAFISQSLHIKEIFSFFVSYTTCATRVC